MKNGQKNKISMSPFGMNKRTDDDDSWITINGTHVAVNGEGEITKGPGNLKSSGKSGKQTSNINNGTNNTPTFKSKNDYSKSIASKLGGPQGTLKAARSLFDEVKADKNLSVADKRSLIRDINYNYRNYNGENAIDASEYSDLK